MDYYSLIHKASLHFNVDVLFGFNFCVFTLKQKRSRIQCLITSKFIEITVSKMIVV